MTMTIKTEFPVTPADVSECLDFALNVQQSRRQFGSTLDRRPEDVVADTLEGKIAEIVAQQFLRQFGINIILDFALYDRNQTDEGQDIWAVHVDSTYYASGFRLDIKATGFGSRWLLLEEHKFHHFHASGYLLIKLKNFISHSSLRKDPQQARGKGCCGVVAGWTYSSEFFDRNGVPWFEFTQGEILFDPSTLGHRSKYADATELQQAVAQARRNGSLTGLVRLDAPRNYGLPIFWLRQDWDTLAREIREGLGQRLPPPRLVIDERGWLRNKPAASRQRE